MENAFWAFVGFVAGLLGGIYIERHNRFRATLDETARSIRDFPQRMHETATPLDLSLLVIETFKDVQFEMELQGQLRARDEIGKLRSEIDDIVHIANTDLLKPETSHLLQFANRDYHKATKILAGDRLNQRRDAMIARAMEIRPDWLVLFLGRGAGKLWRHRSNELTEYLNGTGELKGWR